SVIEHLLGPLPRMAPHQIDPAPGRPRPSAAEVPPQPSDPRCADDRLVEGDAPGGAEEAGVAEAEDPAVGGDEPVALSGGAGGSSHDRLVEGDALGGAEGAGVAEAEDPAVGGVEPVAGAGGDVRDSTG